MTKEYTQSEWNTPIREYACVQNELGLWWVICRVRTESRSQWFTVYLQDSKPYKTLKGAIKLVEKHLENFKR